VAKKAFYEETKKLRIPKGLYSMINNFGFRDKSWLTVSEDYIHTEEINEGWSTQKWKDWIDNNSQHPLGNPSYQKVIEKFRRGIRFNRGDLYKLTENVIKHVFEDKLENFEISIDEGIKKADFYTNISMFKEAYSCIFKGIRDHSSLFPNQDGSKRFAVTYKRRTDDYFLRMIEIIHYGSYPAKEKVLLIKEWKEKGNMGKIYTNLEGYCHWSVETMIEDKPTKINLLKENDQRLSEDIDVVEGFKHILTFYYK
jgi:hypothetical protein